MRFKGSKVVGGVGVMLRFHIILGDFLYYSLNFIICIELQSLVLLIRSETSLRPGLSVGRSVCHYFLKGWEVSLITIISLLLVFNYSNIIHIFSYFYMTSIWRLTYMSYPLSPCFLMRHRFLI